RAIAIGDWGAVAKAKGVGPKTAQRVVNELKDKAPAVMAMGATAPATPPVEDAQVVEPIAPPKPTKVSTDAAAQAAALSALTNLGYGPSEAATAIAEAATEASDEATLIRAALKALAPKG
ncbi:MAG: Holliday junction branch migration protein RuvA, partial [Shimia sp.]